MSMITSVPLKRGRKRQSLTRAQLSILALAYSHGEIHLAYNKRIVGGLFAAGLLRPYPGDHHRSGRYQITKKGREARDRAARMSLVPPGDDQQEGTRT